MLVTPRSFRDADPATRERLERSVREVRYNDADHPLSGPELHAELGDIDGMIAGLDRLDAKAIAAARRLRVIARYGVGVDTVDVAAAARAGITVTITPEANAVAVAELTMTLILALLRRLTELDRAVRAAEWKPLPGGELRGRTVGIVGLGRIGTAVAARARGFDCAVLAADPARTPDDARALGVELVEVAELARRSEILTLHAPATEQSRHLVDSDLLAALPEGALLVNTARASLVDEAAIVDALDSGHLAGAALDVLDREPPPLDHPLIGRPNVIVTPHAAAQTAESTAAMARESTSELLTVLGGGEPRFPVAPSDPDPSAGGHEGSREDRG